VKKVSCGLVDRWKRQQDTRNIIRRYSRFVCHVCDVVVKGKLLGLWMTELKMMKRGRSFDMCGEGCDTLEK
jgi:hypothetical protein